MIKCAFRESFCKIDYSGLWEAINIWVLHFKQSGVKMTETVYGNEILLQRLIINLVIKAMKLGYRDPV